MSLRLACFALILGVPLLAQRGPSVTGADRRVVQPILISPGSTPFHLVAGVADDKAVIGSIEWLWIDPSHYKRIIKSPDFSQVLIINGEKAEERSSSDYMPLQWNTFAMALVDSSFITHSIRDGDRLETKANRLADDSGISCFDKARTMCFKSPGGLSEVVAASGHGVVFTNYESFEGKRVARTITNAARLGENKLTAKVTLLEKWEKPYDSLLAINSPTADGDRLRVSVLSESDLRKQAETIPEIIWPQPLDGAEHGSASFYVSTDRTGKVREVLQLYTANERTNDSAIRQIRRWRFKPFTKDGIPQQMEGVLSFTLNTRKWGPKNPLTDAEVRKLATDIVEPVVDGSKYPPGTTYTLWAAIDTDGQMIEAMTGEGPNDLWQACYDAARSWHFNPIMENGEARPYRANLVFHIN